MKNEIKLNWIEWRVLQLIFFEVESLLNNAFNVSRCMTFIRFIFVRKFLFVLIVFAVAVELQFLSLFQNIRQWYTDFSASHYLNAPLRGSVIEMWPGYRIFLNPSWKPRRAGDGLSINLMVPRIKVTSSIWVIPQSNHLLSLRYFRV